MEKKTTAWQELAPQYVKGDLASEQCEAFETELQVNDALQQTVADYTAIDGSYADLTSQLPEPPADTFSKIMNTIEKEDTAVAKQSFTPVFQKIRAFFTMPQPAWGLAAAQFALILVLVFSGPDESSFKTLSDTNGSANQPGVALNVMFQDTAGQAAITNLLKELDVVIVGGPSQNGLYILKVPETQSKDSVIKKLKTSPEIKFVQVRY